MRVKMREKKKKKNFSLVFNLVWRLAVGTSDQNGIWTCMKVYRGRAMRWDLCGMGAPIPVLLSNRSGVRVGIYKPIVYLNILYIA
jgi:hypothetical protein